MTLRKALALVVNLLKSLENAGIIKAVKECGYVSIVVKHSRERDILITLARIEMES